MQQRRVDFLFGAKTCHLGAAAARALDHTRRGREGEMHRRLRMRDQLAADASQRDARAGAPRGRRTVVPSRVDVADVLATLAEQRLDRRAKFPRQRERD